MYILAVETCINRTSIALSKDNYIIKTCAAKRESVQAETLLHMIEDLLFSNHLSYADITYIALTRGPGSFTGIRVGVTFAKAAQICQQIIVLSLSTLEIIAGKMISMSSNFDHYVAVQNAYRNQLYVQNFTHDLQPQSDIEIINITDIEDYYQRWKGMIASAGSGIQSIDLDHVSRDKRRSFFPRFQYPEARTIAHIAYNKIRKGDINSDLRPLYIRKPDATMNTSSKIILR